MHVVNCVDGGQEKLISYKSFVRSLVFNLIGQSWSSRYSKLSSPKRPRPLPRVTYRQPRKSTSYVQKMVQKVDLKVETHPQPATLQYQQPCRRSHCQDCQSHRSYDSLSRIRHTVGHWSVVFVGSRTQQTLLARFRLGHCCLRAHMSRSHPVSPLCVCGESETVRQFLLEC
jgi:hypothetical protein